MTAPSPQPTSAPAAAPPPAGELAAQLAAEQGRRATAEASVRHGLTAADMAIVGTFGTPEQIEERAAALAAALAGRAAAAPPPPPTPGLPPSPNAGHDGVTVTRDAASVASGMATTLGVGVPRPATAAARGSHPAVSATLTRMHQALGRRPAGPEGGAA